MYAYAAPDWWYEPEDKIDIWAKEMDNLKEELLKALSQIVQLNYVEAFANILYYAFFEEEDFAVQLCKEWGLKDRHFYAFREEKDKLKECFTGKW